MRITKLVCLMGVILCIAQVNSAVAAPQPGHAGHDDDSARYKAESVPAPDGTPVFSLAWSEYPSWSTYGVAAEVGIVDGRKGWMTGVEIEIGIDYEFRGISYNACLTAYGTGSVDAVCITNIDIMSPSLTRASTAILPTSTSHGADALIVTGDITSIEDLRGMSIHGLASSVSEYTFDRNLQKLGLDPADYKFTNMEPDAASMAMQQGSGGVTAIVVWNPFVLQTLNKRADAKVLFDSTSISGEIIDMVVMGNDSLEREGGSRAAVGLAKVFYLLNDRLSNPSTRDDTLIALGEKFATLSLKNMRKVCRQTKFYGTPAEGIKVFQDQELSEVMAKVTGYCSGSGMTASNPTIAYGFGGSDPTSVNLRFDSRFMQEASKKCPAGCTKPCCKK